MSILNEDIGGESGFEVVAKREWDYRAGVTSRRVRSRRGYLVTPKLCERVRCACGGRFAERSSGRNGRAVLRVGSCLASVLTRRNVVGVGNGPATVRGWRNLFAKVIGVPKHAKLEPVQRDWVEGKGLKWRDCLYYQRLTC